jgi:LPXTG-motif cell wall-anchored protein
MLFSLRGLPATGDHRTEIILLTVALLALCLGGVCYALFARKKEKEETKQAAEQDSTPNFEQNEQK